MQQLHVDTSVSSSAGSAWDEHADAALLNEMAALLSPLVNSTTSSSSFLFTTSVPLPQQQEVQHTAQSATAIVVHSEGNAAMVDVDQDLDMLHDMLDAQAQNSVRSDEFKLASILAPLVPPPAPPAPPIQPPIASTLASKTPRERQKNELDDLRTQVAELEAELEKRKQQQQRKRVAALTRSTQLSSSTDSSDNAVTSWWASAAQRQIQEKARVAADNAVLRDVALGQLRLAKSLEKVLEKRRVRLIAWHYDTRAWCAASSQVSCCVCDGRQLCESAVLSASALASLPSDVARDDSVAFAHLTRALESRTLTTDAVFQAHELNAMTADVVDAGIARGGDTSDAPATDLTIKVVKLHPFDYRAVDDACWRCLQSLKQTSSDVDGSVVIDASDDTVAVRCVQALQPNLPLLVRAVVRRKHEAARVIYEWETAVESLASPSSHSTSARHSSIQIITSGWGSIEPITLPNTSVACITRHFARARPTFEARSDAGARHVSSSSGALTHLLIASYLQRIESLHESIQDTLLARQLAR